MPAQPISPETLQLMDAVRDALMQEDQVEERSMFGVNCFFVEASFAWA